MFPGIINLSHYMGMKAIGQIKAITLVIKKKKKSTPNTRGHFKNLKVNIPHYHPMNTVQTPKTTNGCLNVHLADHGKQGFSRPGRNRIEVIFQSKEVISIRKPTGEEARSISRWELLFSATLMQLCQCVGESVLLHQTHQQPESELPSSLYLDIFA